MTDKNDRPVSSSSKGREQLTEARIARAAPGSRRILLADSTVPGLVVRIEPSGSKSYFVRSRIGRGRGAPWAELRVGNPSQMRLATARNEARKLLADMRTGVDPRIAQVGQEAVSEVISRYDLRLESRGVVKRTDVTRSLRTNLSRLLKRPIGDVTRADIVHIIEEIENSGRPGAAEDFRKHVVAMLNWAVGAGMLLANPMAGYRRERSTRVQRLRRPKPIFRTSEEISRFWNAAASASDPIFATFLRFLLLTGQRRTETATMRWAVVKLDGEDPMWEIPAENRKMGDPHRVPLGAQSVELLNSLPHLSSGLIFPGRGGVVMSGWTKRLKPIRNVLGMPAFAFHALRRTYRTGLSELGISFEIAELMIGHARSDFVRRYDQALLWEERRNAQERWEEFIGAVQR